MSLKNKDLQHLDEDLEGVTTIAQESGTSISLVELKAHVISQKAS